MKTEISRKKDDAEPSPVAETGSARQTIRSPTIETGETFETLALSCGTKADVMSFFGPLNS